MTARRPAVLAAAGLALSLLAGGSTASAAPVEQARSLPSYSFSEVGDLGGAASFSSGRAALWPRGGDATALPWLADTDRSLARAWDIADDGTVVGQATAAVPHDDHVDYRGHAVRWDHRGVRSEVTDLGVLEEDGTSTAYALAGPGRHASVVGEASLAGGTRAVTFSTSGPEALPTPDALRHARANDVNRRGDVVGHASGFYGFPTLDGTAVLWHDGQAYELGDLATDLPEGWVLRTAEEINERGQIVGYGTVGGQTRGFLLTPAR